MALDVRTISLAAAFEETRIVNDGKPVGAVTVLRLPAGASFFLRVGTQPEIPITSTGALTGISPYGDGNKGVFLRNAAAQPGVTMDILIGFADVEQTPPPRITK